MEQRIFHLYSLIRVFTLLQDHAVIERLLSFTFSSDYCSFVLVWRISAAAWGNCIGSHGNLNEFTLYGVCV